jgi:hypothetical protein
MAVAVILNASQFANPIHESHPELSNGTRARSVCVGARGARPLSWWVGGRRENGRAPRAPTQTYSETSK